MEEVARETSIGKLTVMGKVEATEIEESEGAA